MSVRRGDANSEHSLRLRWTAAGVLFGAIFPVVGWLLAMAEPGVDGVIGAHGAQPVLYIVDTAPLVLGLTAFGIGVFHTRLVRIRLSIEATVQARTADLQQALDDLSVAQADLLSAQKLEAIGALAAGIAHEINTPIQYVGDNTKFVGEALEALLAVTDAASELAKAAAALPDLSEVLGPFEQAAATADLEFLVEEVPTALEESQAGLEQVASIVRALKSFAHPGTEEKSPADLNELITTTIEVARNEWKYVAEMDLDGLDPKLPMVPVLAGPLKQVLLNMIINAAQAIDEARGDDGPLGRISISSSIVGDHARIEIADTGGGIPPDIQNRIFEPFFTTKEVGKGSGQGLAIAQSIVSNHDGELRLSSTPGEGTVFTISLPVGPGAVPTSPAAQRVAS